MPILKNAKKALRRDNRRAAVNKTTKDQMKAAVKAVKDKKDAKLLPAAYRAIDRAVKKNIVNKNKAAHMKAQLVAALKKTGTAAPTKPTKKASKVAKPASKKAPAKKAASKKASPQKATKAKKASK